MSDIFFISLTWAIVFLVVASLISILVYLHFRSEKLHDLVVQYIIDNPKEAIRLLNRYKS